MEERRTSTIVKHAHPDYRLRREASRPAGRYTAELARELEAQLSRTWSPEQIAEKRRATESLSSASKRSTAGCMRVF
ncbi:hypothetical protein [Paenibacillus sophorae]|uniref:Uncharacterized protein n=1 Tax=Paenibacillus sophorae TaxID=1333845 RepID=A0ABX8HHQ5_9BACL|nr:hypothetical protein [Paenibacillus sophorae]QWU17618.1 hypothetical protein KP014_11040 [Paenibacillus sophorae]